MESLNTRIAIDVITKVSKGEDILDSQSAQLIIDHISNLSDKLRRRGIEIADLKHKLKNLTSRIKDVLELEPDISNAAKDTLWRGIN